MTVSRGVFANAAAGNGVLVLLLLLAFGWGALHALSPGHGKAMVAAYLVGTHGTARDAVALGGVVTVTHTIGVFALGLVTLALSQYIVPEQLYPWLTLASGLLIVVIGAGVLRARVRGYRAASRRARAGSRPMRMATSMGTNTPTGTTTTTGMTMRTATPTDTATTCPTGSPGVASSAWARRRG